jgi:hypothetical protein
MREHGWHPKVRRRFVATTDSDHDSPIFANLAKDVARPARTSCGSPTSSPLSPGQALHRPAEPLHLRRYHSGCLVAPDRRLRHRAEHRRPSDGRGLEGRHHTKRARPGCIHYSDRRSQGGFKWSSQHSEEVAMSRRRRRSDRSGRAPLPSPGGRWKRPVRGDSRYRSSSALAGCFENCNPECRHQDGTRRDWVKWVRWGQTQQFASSWAARPVISPTRGLQVLRSKLVLWTRPRTNKPGNSRVVSETAYPWPTLD